MDVKLPNAEQLNEDALSIPLHPNLKMDEVEYIISKIKLFFK
jgi:dTDP-4-amino-4,6-dideoxygalactose transaminase